MELRNLGRSGLRGFAIGLGCNRFGCHQPAPLTPVEETLRALGDLVESRRVHYIGCSNFPAWQIAEVVHTSRAEALNAFISFQDEYSLLVRRIERELMPHDVLAVNDIVDSGVS